MSSPSIVSVPAGGPPVPLQVQTHFLPDSILPGRLVGGTAVVVDILRASTCIVQALAHGAHQVIPVADLEDARQAARTIERSLLVGERQGLRPAGFDLGNSPSEFTRDAIAGRTLIMSTTNGTRALLHCQDAQSVLIGAFLNLSCIVQHVCHTPVASLHLVCAGTNGSPTREDILFAGAVVSKVVADPRRSCELDDASRIAQLVWQDAAITKQPELVRQLAETQGGRNLLAIQHGHDIESASQIDAAPLLACYDAAQGVIHILQ